MIPFVTGTTSTNETSYTVYRATPGFFKVKRVKKRLAKKRRNQGVVLANPYDSVTFTWRGNGWRIRP